MGLKHLDLKDTIYKNISLDEFEPKTGDSKDVAVVGFYVVDQSPAEDLYNYLNNSSLEFRDVDVSPNSNPEGKYMVFVEIDRDDKLIEKIRNIVTEMENVCGKLKWQMSTHLTDDYYPLGDQELLRYVISDPEEYMTKDDFEKSAQEESIMEFFRSSALKNVRINEDTVDLQGNGDAAQLRIVAFGKASEVMQNLNIHESAILEGDSVFRRFNKMLGEMQAVPIDNYVVMFYPNNDNVLVTELC